MKMKWSRYKILFSSLTLILSINGCIPSYTQCRGNVSIQVHPAAIQPLNKKTTERFVVISFWDYPAVNEARGKVIINEVVLSEKNQITIDFPVKGYWVVWTPALGTQHIAPEPGIMVFHKSYLPCWNIGGTDLHPRICCEKPTTQHEFQLELIAPEKSLLQKEGKSLSKKMFFEKFLAKKKDLIGKMDQCKELSAEEKAMVLEKLSSIAKILEIDTCY